MPPLFPRLMKQKLNPPPTGLVLEIGSGDNPNPRSNVLSRPLSRLR